jgi:hypothetical protein
MGLNFPEYSNEVYYREYFVNVKKKALLELEGILREGEERDRRAREMEVLMRYFAGLLKPKALGNVSENENILSDIAFQQVCSVLAENGQNVEENTTVFEFINKTIYVKKRYGKETKQRVVPAGRT